MTNEAFRILTAAADSKGCRNEVAKRLKQFDTNIAGLFGKQSSAAAGMSKHGVFSSSNRPAQVSNESVAAKSDSVKSNP